MFERIKKAVKNWMETVGAKTGLGREFKSIFEIDGVPAFSQFYNCGIFIWKYLYKGFYKAWHLIPAPTIENPAAMRNMSYLNLSKAIAQELSGMVWSDQATVNVSIDGRELAEGETDPLDDFVQSVLRQNAFSAKMGQSIEQAAALGGEALKVWREVRRDREGREIPDTERVRIGYCMADQFVPTAWDNAEITEGVFISRIAKGGNYYTRLEWHKWDGMTYVVTNELYQAQMNKTPTESQDILGYRIPLATIYATLDERVEMESLEHSLFSYFRTPVANNLDDNSPLGMSVYGNCTDTLHALDICFDSFVREFRLGKKRIIVPTKMIKTVVDPQSGRMRRYFDASDETYEALSTDDPDSLKITDNSVTLRVDEHVAAMNAFLNILCLQIGLSAGTFSFDARDGLKTATEVVSENSKTYKTVKNFQNQIKPAVERLVDNIIAVAQLYDMSYNGQKIADLARPGYHVAVQMDDGITQDRQTNINEGKMLVDSGMISKKTFLTDPKYGQCLTDEQADAELARIAGEKKIDAYSIDRLDFATAE